MGLKQILNRPIGSAQAFNLGPNRPGIPIGLDNNSVGLDPAGPSPKISDSFSYTNRTPSPTVKNIIHFHTCKTHFATLGNTTGKRAYVERDIPLKILLLFHFFISK